MSWISQQQIAVRNEEERLGGEEEDKVGRGDMQNVFNQTNSLSFSKQAKI